MASEVVPRTTTWTPCKLGGALAQEISLSLRNRFLSVGARAGSLYRLNCHKQDLIVAPSEAGMSKCVTAAGQNMCESLTFSAARAFGVLGDSPPLQVVAWGQHIINWANYKGQPEWIHVQHFMPHDRPLHDVVPCSPLSLLYHLWNSELSISLRLSCTTSEALTGALALDHLVKWFHPTLWRSCWIWPLISSNFEVSSDFFLGPEFPSWSELWVDLADIWVRGIADHQLCSDLPHLVLTPVNQTLILWLMLFPSDSTKGRSIS